LNEAIEGFDLEDIDEAVLQSFEGFILFEVSAVTHAEEFLHFFFEISNT
jgi:hypothetical protein